MSGQASPIDWFAQNAPPQQAQSGGDWFAANAPKQAGAISRFSESFSTGLGAKPGFVDTLKDMGSGLKQMVTHPITSGNLLLHGAVDAQQEVIDKAYQEQQSPDFWTQAKGYIRGAESAIPLVGPMLSKAGDEFASGNLAGGFGTTAAIAAPAVMGKVGPKIPEAVAATPAAIQGGWRKIGNPFGLASTGQELLTQGISPRTSMTNFKPSLARAAADLKAFDAESPIKSVQDLNDAIPDIKRKIWNEEVEPALKRQGSKPVEMKPVADAVRNQISDEMREFDEGNADKLDALATKLENARDVTSANKLLKYVNGQLESYFQKFPAARRANLMNNPETAGWEAARAELRNQFLTTLEDAGETGVRDARLRYGAFDTLQDAVERRVNVADRAKPMSLGRIVGLAAAIPTAGLSVVAGELSNYLNKPDILVKRGIRKLPSAPADGSKQLMDLLE